MLDVTSVVVNVLVVLQLVSGEPYPLEVPSESSDATILARTIPTAEKESFMQRVNEKVNDTNILVIIPQKAEDIEVVTTLTVLRKARLNTQFAGLQKALVTVICERDLMVVPDADMVMVLEDRPYDMIILPGGKGYINYLRSKPLRRVLQEQDVSKRLIGAISTAPMALDYLKLAVGKFLTARPDWTDFLLSNHPVADHSVVHDGHLLTCQGPGAVMEFALYVVELFKGKETANEVAESLGYRRNSSMIKVVNSNFTRIVYS